MKPHFYVSFISITPLWKPGKEYHEFSIQDMDGKLTEEITVNT